MYNLEMFISSNLVFKICLKNTGLMVEKSTVKKVTQEFIPVLKYNAIAMIAEAIIFIILLKKLISKIR